MNKQTLETGVVMTLNAIWWTEFQESLEGSRDAKTVRAYIADIEHFAAWFHKANGLPFEPGVMNTRDLKDFRTWSLEVEKVKPATWNRRRASLGLLCAWCEQVNGPMVVKFQGALKAEREQAQAPRWLEPTEERKLMRQVEININAAKTVLQRERAIRDQGLVGLMRFAGLRVEEAADLELEDILLSERKGTVVVRNGKRDKRREVPLSSSVRDALRAWLAVRGQQAGSLFGGMSARAIQKRIEGLADQTGIEDLSCHALRHTCAKSMVDAGRPLTEVQQILGHEKLETTARYIRPGREDLAEAVEAGELGKLRRA